MTTLCLFLSIVTIASAASIETLNAEESKSRIDKSTLNQKNAATFYPVTVGKSQEVSQMQLIRSQSVEPQFPVPTWYDISSETRMPPGYISGQSPADLINADLKEIVNRSLFSKISQLVQFSHLHVLLASLTSLFILLVLYTTVM